MNYLSVQQQLSRGDIPIGLKTITINDFIRLTHISRSQFFKKIRPTMPVIRMGSRKVVIAEKAAIEWLKNRTEVQNKLMMMMMMRL